MNRLLTAATYAATHAAGHIDVSDMARAAGMSRSYFTRRFKQAMGITPARYLTAVRIEKAKVLLATTAMPIIHVAVECGFSSQSSLTTAFKAATGITPATYRRQSEPPPMATPICAECPLWEILGASARVS